MLQLKQRPRIYYTEANKSLMWDRWQKGESLNAIARLFDRHHSAIQGILSRSGGIRPPERRRSRLALTIAEREEISRGVVAGHSIRSIAMSLGRVPFTVSREISRNGDRRRYRANRADRAAWDRARRPKICKLAENRALARIVAEKLQLQWSPRQIAGWLQRDIFRYLCFARRPSPLALRLLVYEQLHNLIYSLVLVAGMTRNTHPH